MKTKDFLGKFKAVDCAVQSSHMDCYSETRDDKGYPLTRSGRMGSTVMLSVDLWNEIKKRLKL